MWSILVLFGSLLFTFIGYVLGDSQIKLSIYYETLCPDSVRFFRNQLDTTYAKIGSHLELEFVPYGLALHQKVNGNWDFHCQHGKEECNGNKYHACSLVQNTDQTQAVKFLNCAMKRSNPASPRVLQKCAKRTETDFEAMKSCLEGAEGDELLVKYGDRTKGVKPEIRYIPTLILNDVYNKTFQDNAEMNLLGTLCQLLDPKPEGCASASYDFVKLNQEIKSGMETMRYTGKRLPKV